MGLNIAKNAAADALESIVGAYDTLISFHDPGLGGGEEETEYASRQIADALAIIIKSEQWEMLEEFSNYRARIR